MNLSHASPTPDELVRRYVDGVRSDLEPDPLFRRRLRGLVTNRFVAAREGIDAHPAEPRRLAMGALGRACLYASFALGVSVGGVMAASRAAIPGDILYPVKLQIEALRAETLPAQYQDDLAILALSERMHEMARLAESGDWGAVAALAPVVEAGYDQLDALGIGDSIADEALEHRMEVLQMLRDNLPAPALAAIDHVLGREPARQLHAPLGPGNPAGARIPPSSDGQGGGALAAIGDVDDHPAAQPAPTTGPAIAPRPTPTARPTPTPRPTPAPRVAPQQPSPSRAGDQDNGNVQPEDGS